MPSMFEEMDADLATDDEGDDEAAEPKGDDAKAAPELDGEFAMLAEKLGYTGDKAETFKQAVERCVQLREEGSYTEPVEPVEPAAAGDLEGDLDDEELDF